MQLDRRIPAVYVDVFDQSYVAPALDVGRVGYIVIVGPRGRQNQIVEVNSIDQFREEFGKANMDKTWQAHYIAEAFLTYSSKLYVVRVVPDSNTGFTGSDIAYWSNRYIDFVDNSILIAKDYTFTSGSSTIVAADEDAWNQFDVGDWIYSANDTSTNAEQIVNKYQDPNTSEYKFTLASAYQGTTGTSNAYKYVAFDLNNEATADTENDFDDTLTNRLYYFYALGGGSWYNRLKLRGIRNVDYEKLYVDDDGNVLYPYLFMDLSLYQINEDGSETLLEEYGTVSLAPEVYQNGDKVPIIDITTGNVMYIADVINRKSKYIRCKGCIDVTNILIDASIPTSDPTKEKRRLYVMTMFTEGNVLGLDNVGQDGVQLAGGTDGLMYDSQGRITILTNTKFQGLVQQAYRGTLNDDISLIRQVIYPPYKINYVICGGYPPDIINAAADLVNTRGDCHLICDTGANHESADDDLNARLNDVPFNSWHATIYVQYRKRRDPNTGKDYYFTPVYHAIQKHLYVDGVYGITEPVAGIEKGSIDEKIELSYVANQTKLGDLLDKQLNPTIVEPDGKYFLHELTAYKRLSVLRNTYVAKFIEYLVQTLPTILKDILHRKATSYWLGEADRRVKNFMANFLDNPSNPRWSILKSYSSTIQFVEERQELVVILTIHPIRSIQRINVRIIVT